MTRNRRQFLLALTAAAAACSSPKPEPAADEGASLELSDFEPTSALVVPGHDVAKARFPAIDVHTHLFMSTGLQKLTNPDAKPFLAEKDKIDEAVRWMDELNIQTMVNLTGGWGEELDQAVEALAKGYPGRFVVCTEPAWTRISEPDYPQWQAAEIERAKQAGAVGIKALKTLGLFLRENGKLVAIDDPRFDPMWEAAGKLNMPIFIHSADPDAFFTPIDRHNERWEELANHPDWSFYGEDFPPKDELLAARNRVIERHPNTKFVGLHVGNRSENLAQVAEWLDRYPNFHVEIGARLGELGRQPRASRAFFEKYQDRILFGTDAIPLPLGASYPQQTLEPEMFRLYFRFLETEDEYFDYSTAPTPPQGRWQIYGVGLPEEILRKVYHDNAAALLGID